MSLKWKLLNSLRFCSCSNISDGGIESFYNTNHRFEVIEISHCHKITVTGLKKMLNNSKHSLNELDLTACVFNNIGFNDFMFENFINIEILRLDGMDETIDDLAIHIIAQTCLNLKELYLDSCELITDNAIVVLSIHCKFIEVLDLFECYHISYNSIVIILEVYEATLREFYTSLKFLKEDFDRDFRNCKKLMKYEYFCEDTGGLFTYQDPYTS
jgi:hypothetical protein